jgi:A/G-specific adenine glycosylase
LHHFPTVQALAAAPEEKVLKLWQGLGYYSRARNLHFTAKKICSEMNGKFPSTFKELLLLKGVGTYTAAAIASFAFNEPVAVVDGNAIRVLSRFFGIYTPFDLPTGKKEFFALAQKLIPVHEPAAFNQAIMDFGAVVCTPAKPNCATCVLQEKCFAFKYQAVEKLPQKAKRITKKNRRFLFVIIIYNHHIFLEQRTGTDIWKHLYQPPMIELPKRKNQSVAKLLSHLLMQKKVELKSKIITYKQLLTHQELLMYFVTVECNHQMAQNLAQRFIAVPLSEISNYAFPKTIALHLQKIGLI